MMGLDIATAYSRHFTSDICKTAFSLCDVRCLLCAVAMSLAACRMAGSETSLGQPNRLVLKEGRQNNVCGRR